jgi:hypothetical protein
VPEKEQKKSQDEQTENFCELMQILARKICKLGLRGSLCVFCLIGKIGCDRFARFPALYI